MRAILSSDERGFTLVEILVGVMVAIILLSTAGLGVMKAFDIQWKNESSNNLKRMVNAYRAHYMEMRSTAANYDQNIFYWNNRSVLPLVLNSGNPDSPNATGSDILIFSAGKALFYEAGCSLVAEGAASAHLTCADSFGTPVRVQATNQRPMSFKASYPDLASPYFNPTVPTEVGFTSAGPDKAFGTADDIVEVFSSSDLDNYYIAKTEEDMRNILSAIKAFHSQRLYTETVELTYENSLASYDDVKVPWVWQLYAIPIPPASPKTKCIVPNVQLCRPAQTCFCPYDPTHWPQVAYTPWDFTSVFWSQQLFMNLGLIQTPGLQTVKDHFGMPMVVDLITGATTTPPPVPSDRYSWVSPPFISTIRTSWGKVATIALVN